MKYYIHSVPGRIRVRIPSLRNNSQELGKIGKILNLNGTKKVHVNGLTGSIVVKYDPDLISARFLLDILKDNGYYDDKQVLSLDSHLKPSSSAAARKIRQALFGWAVGKILRGQRSRVDCGPNLNAASVFF